ncbi:YjiH family protein [Pseudoalteromonas ruthenica]|uniref:YjiH family protein n=1 Tax=Pseudoalteromonas ruthenica TaxID=151081 RepID=UPI001243CDD4|nr:YjiH family protein [Pseudoalteromonas ruthenica]
MTTSQPRSMASTLLTFIIPSLIGVFLFMVPIPWEGEIKITVAILADMLRVWLAPIASTLLLIIICGTGLLSLLMSTVQPRSLFDNTLIRHLFVVTPVWLVVRLLGMVFVVMTYFELGPVAIHSENTGAFVMNELLPLLLTVFILAGFLLPLLLNFGLLELVGTLFTKIMQPLFGVPGRSAVNCAASWLGDGSVGILMTARQYEDKHYTQREAAIIGTTFSAVSITFCFVVIGQVRLEHLFAPFYLTVCVAGVVCALILPRIPPLSLKKNTYVDGSTQNQDDESHSAQKNLWRQSLDMALHKARHAKGVKGTVQEGVHNALDMVFAVLPVVMAVGTFALIISEYTPVFTWLGKPFIPYLELLGIPEAVKASETIVVGFADMFIPSILAASNIDSEVTRFIIAAMSVTQLIYMSEVGALLLGSKIPVNIVELFIIFILRTLITLPVITLMANWLVA